MEILLEPRVILVGLGYINQDLVAKVTKSKQSPSPFFYQLLYFGSIIGEMCLLTKELKNLFQTFLVNMPLVCALLFLTFLALRPSVRNGWARPWVSGPRCARCRG